MSEVAFIVHYVVKTAARNLHFDLVFDSPPAADTLHAVRCDCAGAANAATKRTGSRSFAPDDIVIANIIPVPRTRPVKQLGGS